VAGSSDGERRPAAPPTCATIDGSPGPRATLGEKGTFVPRRDNGLPAASFVALADVDPPLTQHVLDVLAAAAIAAYAEPIAGETGPYRDVRPPDRPTTRVYVDRSERARAREVLGRLLPGLRAEFLADVAARTDRVEVAQAEVDAAWAGIVAGFDTPTEPSPIPPWPVAEDVNDPDPGEPEPAGSGLSGRLVRRAPTPTPDPATGTEADADHAAAAADPDDPTDHYVPPHPPPLPPPRDTIQRFAWAAAIGGPLLLVAAHVFGLEPWLGGVGVAAFFGGFATLVARMQERSPQDDGWDDGAVV
jgi:hypothetical protein